MQQDKNFIFGEIDSFVKPVDEITKNGDTFKGDVSFNAESSQNPQQDINQHTMGQNYNDTLTTHKDKNTINLQEKSQNGSLNASFSHNKDGNSEFSSFELSQESHTPEYLTNIKGRKYIPTGFEYFDNKMQNDTLNIYDGFIASNFLKIDLSGHFNVDLNANVNMKLNGTIGKKNLNAIHKELNLSNSLINNIDELLQTMQGGEGVLNDGLTAKGLRTLNNMGVGIPNNLERQNQLDKMVQEQTLELLKTGNLTQNERDELRDFLSLGALDYPSYLNKVGAVMDILNNKTKANIFKAQNLGVDTKPYQVVLDKSMDFTNQIKQRANEKVNFITANKKAKWSKEDSDKLNKKYVVPLFDEIDFEQVATNAQNQANQ